MSCASNSASLRLPQIGQVSGQHQDIGFLGDLAEQFAIGNPVVLANVKIAHGGDLHACVA